MTTEPKNRMETMSRLARWKINDLASSFLHRSDGFSFSSCTRIWRLTAEKNAAALSVKLFLHALKESMPTIFGERFPEEIHVRFSVRMLYFDRQPKCLIHPGVVDKKFISCTDPFVWDIRLPISGRIIIDVELLDIEAKNLKRKILDSGESSVGPHDGRRHDISPSVRRMLTDSILTDIDIRTSDGGTFPAHRSILAAQSSVFQSMFSHNLMEKQLSAVNIPDMSSESCKAFLKYLYGTISQDELTVHQLELLRLADKYNVVELRKECQDSLLKNMNTENVLGRLQIAVLYGLDDLKRECLRFLVTFGKICEVKHELRAFIESADREVILVVFNEVLAAWNGFWSSCN